MDRKRSQADARRPRSSAPVHELTRKEMESTVHLLNYELYVARIPKDDLSSATHSLLQILLRLFGESQDCRRYTIVNMSMLCLLCALCLFRNHFFNFTATSTEYSVILDKELLQSE